MINELKEVIINHCELRKFKAINKNVKQTNLRLKNAQYVRCGENVVLGEGCRLLCWDSYNGSALENAPEIKIGDRFHATRNLVIQCANKVIIGNDVLVASNVFIIDYNHGMDPMALSYLDNPLSISEGIRIDDGVWVGERAIILGGIKIGKKAIIGAGSIVTGDVDPYTMVAGNPAKRIKMFNEKTLTWERVN